MEQKIRIKLVKDKNKEVQQRVNMLSEQVQILISNININNKIKPQTK
jgi:hypothetical protein